MTMRLKFIFFSPFFLYSSYEGWDNPFRPEGELSHEAEELLKLWKQGKLKSHPGDPSSPNSRAVQKQGGGDGEEEDEAVTATAAAAAVSSPSSFPSQAPSDGQKVKQQQNGDSSNLKNGGKGGGGAPVDVRRENMPQLVNPKTVTLGGGGRKDQLEPTKKKTGGCCSIM